MKKSTRIKKEAYEKEKYYEMLDRVTYLYDLEARQYEAREDVYRYVSKRIDK